MQKYLNILLMAMLCLLYSSCTKYQYVTVVGELKQDASKSFIIENDTLRIKYSFRGTNCPVQIELFNKLNKPIYIDWKKSALILNDERFSYWIDKANVNLNSAGYEIHWSSTLSDTYGQINGTISKNDQVSFIPPKSFTKYSPLTIKDKFFILPPPEPKQKRLFAGSSTNLTGYQYTFDKNNTPLKFRSYLTLSVDENFSSTFYFDNQFWVNEILTINGDDAGHMNQLSDQFIISETMGKGVGGCILGSAIVVGLLYLSKNNSN